MGTIEYYYNVQKSINIVRLINKELLQKIKTSSWQSSKNRICTLQNVGF